ncbi:GTPase HflX [Alkaliphilus serpentinus]|uniref:GTPase HflX n=1 Tax=Alkaliphilus serpentinus TaxID=1482731 RepID=A0A833M7X5_9FIRM|nr:GTPase HflX [Alkaliphilus serpentinus]KAB3531472.1 GTPase HflX [Alkaliphilus serpentinus]
MTIETRENIQHRGILVGMDDFKRNENIDIETSMEELAELAQAAGVEVLASAVQGNSALNAALYIGKGKAEEIRDLCKNLDANLVIFNDELSGSQIRNLEEVIGVDVIDRPTLILDIFASRATAKDAKLQVELAQLKYRLPRLTGLGKKLSRLGAGIGTRGPGETKLETDRRHIERRIDFIKDQLKEVKKNREVQRSKRKKSELPIVALVGYTNSGKSTLMNTFMKNSLDYEVEREVYAEDMLFATLEVSLRKMSYPDNLNFLLTDTVGFVSKLPHDLVDAFKATLEEVKYADLLLHIIDASNENHKLQRETTLKVLKELKVEDKKIIEVYNKVDKLEDPTILPKDSDTIAISALKGNNLQLLLELIRREIGDRLVDTEVLLPYDKGNLSSKLYEIGNVTESEYRENGIYIKLKLPYIHYHLIKDYEIS